MKFAKSRWVGPGSLVMAALIVVLLAPRAAHAIAATAVQVMNTTTAPVPTRDVDAAGRNVFIQSCNVRDGLGDCALSPVVPAGSIFVIQQVSYRTETNGAAAQTVIFNSAYGDPLNPIPQTVVIPPASDFNISYGSANTTSYQDSRSQTSTIYPVGMTHCSTLSYYTSIADLTCTAAGYLITYP